MTEPTSIKRTRSDSLQPAQMGLGPRRIREYCQQGVKRSEILQKTAKAKLKDFVRRGGLLSVPDERTFLYRHLSDFAARLHDERVLDIGAGFRQYEHLFDRHGHYQSCDLEDGFHPGQKHDFLGSIYDLPHEDQHYDVVLMLQVLEHLEFPVKALREVNRILKDGGLVFLSVPQSAGDHFEPNHFFNYTQFGLRSVLRQAEFSIQEHHRLAGMFTYVGNRIDKLGSLVFNQCESDQIVQKAIAWLFRVICSRVGWIISRFDFVDRKKAYCISHIVIARKGMHLSKPSNQAGRSPTA